MKFLLITVLLTVITARNGFREAYSSAPDPGSMGRVVSTDTSIIVSTFARATAGHCQRVANVRRNVDRSFTEKRCMPRVVVRHPGGGRCRELMSSKAGLVIPRATADRRDNSARGAPARSGAGQPVLTTQKQKAATASI